MTTVKRLILKPDLFKISRPGVNVDVAADVDLILSTNRKRLQLLETGVTPIVPPNDARVVLWSTTYEFPPFIYATQMGVPGAPATVTDQWTRWPAIGGRLTSNPTIAAGSYTESHTSFGQFFNNNPNYAYPLRYAYSLYRIEGKT